MFGWSLGTIVFLPTLSAGAEDMARPPDRVDFSRLSYLDTMECSRSTYLDEREQQIELEAQLRDCWKRRTRPGYENLMKLRGAGDRRDV